MNYKKFEDSEQEIFLDKYYNYEDTKLILVSIEENDYPLIRKITKIGIKKGIEDFLKNEGVCCLYDSDLAKFCFDYSTQYRVTEEISSVHLKLDNIASYALDVCQTYRAFVYNESRDRFLNLPKTE